MTPARIAIALGVAVVAIFVTPLALCHYASDRNRETSAVLSEAAASRGIGAAAQAPDQSQFSSSTNAASADVNSASGKLRLTIVAADGNLIAGAHVGFGNEPDVADESLPESRNFGWPYYIETVTGADGSWRMDRIAEETINSITGEATHPEHVRSDVDVAGNPEAAKELL